MPSAVVTTIPVDGVPAAKADFRANWTTIKNEIEALQQATFSGDFNGVAAVDYIQPHVTGVTGTLTQAAHGGRPIHITGNVTVPVTSGFVCEIRNKDVTTRTVTPASGSLIHEGVKLLAGASINLPQYRSVLVESDGTDVWVYGAIA